MDELGGLVRYFTNRLGSLREQGGAFRPVTGVGFSASDWQQVLNNSSYLGNRHQAAAQLNNHWEPPRNEVHWPNYHPIPVSDFLSEMERQQREDLEFLYVMQRSEMDEYFER